MTWLPQLILQYRVYTTMISLNAPLQRFGRYVCLYTDLGDMGTVRAIMVPRRWTHHSCTCELLRYLYASHYIPIRLERRQVLPISRPASTLTMLTSTFRLGSPQTTRIYHQGIPSRVCQHGIFSSTHEVSTFCLLCVRVRMETLHLSDFRRRTLR